jgi:hypothetical protein
VPGNRHAGFGKRPEETARLKDRNRASGRLHHRVPHHPSGPHQRPGHHRTPLEHLPPLTRRDGAAPHIAGALTLTAPRTDDPLAGVTAPTPPPTPAAMATQPSHLQQVQADLIAHRDGTDDHTAHTLATNNDYTAYITPHG